MKDLLKEDRNILSMGGDEMTRFIDSMMEFVKDNESIKIFPPLLSTFFRFYAIYTQKCILFPLLQNMYGAQSFDKISAALIMQVDIILQILQPSKKEREQDTTIVDACTDLLSTLMQKGHQIIVK